MTQHPAVQIRHLTKRIGKKTIVDDLSFDIQPGEVFGFLGPNGAGKTTTIRMMVNLVSRTKGEVFIQGIDLSKHFSEAMKHVGVIVENPELYKFLTGYQNLKHFANMSLGVDKQRIDELVKIVGLEGRIHDRVRTYSLGMRQRLGLAVVLLRRPSVLLLDEPTNGLDPAGIRELRDYLRLLANNEGIAVVVSSHLLAEMELMCDRVAIIQNGKLIDVRTLKELATDTGEEVAVTFEVEPMDRAVHLIQQQFPDMRLTSSEKQVVVATQREVIPDIVAALAAEQVRIFGVTATNKSLEDSFLELTGGNQIV